MRHTFGAYLILLATGSVAHAQQVSISATGGRTSHDLVRDPRGVGVGVAWPVGARSLVRVSYHGLSHRGTRVGVTCSGFISDPVTECPREQVDDTGALKGLALGLVTTVARRGNVALAVVPSASLGRARVKSHGRQTGRTLTASDVMMGLEGGLELSIRAPAPWPLAVHVGAHAGILANLIEPPPDAYSPISNDIRLYRVEVGVSLWKPRRGARVTERP